MTSRKSGEGYKSVKYQSSIDIIQGWNQSKVSVQFWHQSGFNMIPETDHSWSKIILSPQERSE